MSHPDVIPLTLSEALQDELLERLVWIAHHQAHAAAMEVRLHGLEEVVSEARLALVAAMRRYDASLGTPLTAYLNQQVKWHLRHALRIPAKRGAGRLHLPITGNPAIDEPNDLIDPTQPDPALDLEAEDLAEFLREWLPEDSWAVLDGFSRGENGYTLGDSLGRTKARVYQIRRRAIAQAQILLRNLA